MKVALTFDDGPNGSSSSDEGRHCDITHELLNVMRKIEVRKKKSMKATFFLVGANVERCSACIEEMILDGHLVANHTMNHYWQKNIGVYEAPNGKEGVQKEILDCNKALANFFLNNSHWKYEFTPRFFRCPQGVYEDGGNNWVEEINKEIGMVKVENINGRRNQYHVPWNADDETWKSDKTWQDIQTKIKQEFTNAKTNKCDLVLLSHDHYDNHRQAWTYDFVEKLVNDFPEVEFVRIDELIGKKDKLHTEEYLIPGQALESPNGMYRLVFQSDANFVLYKEKENGKKVHAVWQHDTQANRKGLRATLTNNGEFIVTYEGGEQKGIIKSETGVITGSYLRVTDQGKIELKKENVDEVFWRSS